MKKILVLIVLISLGLNIGLGFQIWKNRSCSPTSERIWDRPENPGPGGRGKAGGGRSGVFWQEVMERRLTHVMTRLGLDPEQEMAFRSTHQKAAEGFLTQRGKVQEARRQLMDVASGAEFGSEEFKSLIAEVGRQQAKLDSMVTETMLQEMEILNPEQRRDYIRILPINRFGSRGNSGGHRPEMGSGRSRQ